MHPILLIRPLAQSLRFEDDLRRSSPLDLDVIVSPLLQISEIPTEIPDTTFQAILFTSINAVEIFATRTADRSKPAFCVGARMAAAAKHAGFTAHSADGDARNLIQLVKKHCNHNGGPLLYVRGQEISFDLASVLTSARYTVASCVNYRQLKLFMPKSTVRLLETKPAVVPIFSYNSALRFRDELSDTQPRSVWFPCISKRAAEPIVGLENSRYSVAETPNAAAMMRLILQKSV